MRHDASRPVTMRECSGTEIVAFWEGDAPAVPRMESAFTAP